MCFLCFRVCYRVALVVVVDVCVVSFFSPCTWLDSTSAVAVLLRQWAFYITCCLSLSIIPPPPPVYMFSCAVTDGRWWNQPGGRWDVNVGAYTVTSMAHVPDELLVRGVMEVSVPQQQLAPRTFFFHLHRLQRLQRPMLGCFCCKHKEFMCLATWFLWFPSALR
jgi:hypothetical protein